MMICAIARRAPHPQRSTMMSRRQPNMVRAGRNRQSREQDRWLPRSLTRKSFREGGNRPETPPGN